MEDRLVLATAPYRDAVTQLYQDLLHRLPDAGGLDYWAAQLGQGVDTHAVAIALTHSTEFHRGEVDGVYQRLLSRTADEGGRAFFASALDHGQTVQQVEAAVASSPEYARQHGGAGFLDALFNGTDHLKALADGAYQQTLHRAGDTAGLDYWAGRMAAGVRVEDVTASLETSPEREAMPPAGATVLGTFADASALPAGGAGALETSLAGAAHAALGASASGSGTGAAPLGSGPQAVTLKNGLPAVFQAFGPERLVDTRNTVSGQYGGPAFAAGQTRTINVSPYNLSDPSIPSTTIGDQAPTSNLPANVKAVSVILFIVGAPQAEYFTAYATGTSPAPTGTASVFADHAGQIIAASAIVPVNASGNIDIYSSGGGNLIVDVNGYFLDALDGTDNLPISGSVPGGAGTTGVVVGTNANTTAAANGVTGIISSTAPGNTSAGVRGINSGTFSNGYGVWGSQDGSGVGVRGTTSGQGFGVIGSSGNGGVGGSFTGGTGGTGVQGFSTGSGSRGGDFSGDASGIRAIASDAGAVSGVLGQVTSNAAAAGSSGVSGTNASTVAGTTLVGVSGVLGTITSSSPGLNSAGVRGINNSTTGVGNGVVGEVKGMGFAVWGIADTAGGYGVVGQVPTSGFGVLALGDFAATGTKAFVDPSPSDPSKQIAYVALEGNEVGTYFRGTGHFVNGTATIDVPQTFRDVSEAAGLSIQVEPIGALANTAVRSMDLNHIALLSSADVDFYYTVNGVRKGYAGYDPVQSNRIYVPHAANDALPSWLTDTQKQALISNGTYNADGTVNMTTAHNLGWDVLWGTNTSSASTSSGSKA